MNAEQIARAIEEEEKDLAELVKRHERPEAIRKMRDYINALREWREYLVELETRCG